MDVIDTTLKICSPTDSREKLHPKNGADEEQVDKLDLYVT